MAYRPYPNADRALRQLARHEQPAPVVELPCLRPIGESSEQLRQSTQRAVEKGFGLGEYRLSTR